MSIDIKHPLFSNNIKNIDVLSTSIINFDKIKKKLNLVNIYKKKIEKYNGPYSQFFMIIFQYMYLNGNVDWLNEFIKRMSTRKWMSVLEFNEFKEISNIFDKEYSIFMNRFIIKN